jgi:hypothetical protein
MSDSMEQIRAQWEREKAAGLWDEAQLERERNVRRVWIEEELCERKRKAREQFLGKNATEAANTEPSSPAKSCV